MNNELRFYSSILLRRLPLILVVAGILSAVSVYIALTLPTTYRASALLLVESPQIPDSLAASTVGDNAEEQLAIIEQRLLTRANLLDIADKFNVFPNRSEMVPDDIVEQMRARTTFSRSFGRRAATRTLTISFAADRPAVTADVVNEYVTRVLAETVEMRTGMAEQTLDFFEQEVERLGEELDRQSARILEFKNNNIDALPEGMEYRMSRQSLLTERLAQLERDRDALTEQRRRIVEIYEATGRVAGAPQASLSPEQQQLQRLQDELESARALYSEQNPRVKVLMARIDQLESQIAASSGASEQEAANPNEALLNLQLGEIDARLQFIEEQAKLINTELEQLGDAIARTPGNAITLQALERDYSNIRSRYDAATSRLSTAAVGERIELTSKGQRVSVLRQAIVPREPDSPNRPLIMAGGVAASFGVAIALVVLLELLNRTVRRPADLSRALQISPLGTIPYIATRNESFRKKGALFAVIALIAVGIPAGLYLVHVEYMPLDLLADRAMSRIGL